MVKNLKSHLIIMCFLIAIASTAYGTTYTYTTLNVPDIASTSPTGINNAGVIVGSAGDPSGIAPFLYEGGQLYWPIHIPGASYYSYFTGINNSGSIVGYYSTSTLPYTRGFLDVGGTFTPINVPGATRTYPLAINDAGDIVGYCIGTIPGLPGNPAAFLYSTGTYTTFLPPGAEVAEATGINDSGDIVGYTTVVINSLPWQVGFLDTAGSFSYFQDPNVAPWPAGSTYAFGINNSGDIVGEYLGYPGPNSQVEGYYGYVDQSGTFSTVQFPGAGTTVVQAINDSGVIVGWYADDGGYVAVPVPEAAVPEPATMLLLGSGLLGLWGFRRKFKK